MKRLINQIGIILAIVFGKMVRIIIQGYQVGISLLITTIYHVMPYLFVSLLLSYGLGNLTNHSPMGYFLTILPILALLDMFINEE